MEAERVTRTLLFTSDEYEGIKSEFPGAGLEVTDVLLPSTQVSLKLCCDAGQQPEEHCC